MILTSLNEEGQNILDNLRIRGNDFFLNIRLNAMEVFGVVLFANTLIKSINISECIGTADLILKRKIRFLCDLTANFDTTLNVIK